MLSGKAVDKGMGGATQPPTDGNATPPADGNATTPPTTGSDATNNPYK